MKEKKVLIACNSLDFLLISKVLGQGFALDWVQNREEVSKFCKNKSYELLLVDISFLKPDFKLLAAVKKEHIPVVALSSEPYDARDKALSAAGCCACYVKPIRHDLFAAFINYWIEQGVEN